VRDWRMARMCEQISPLATPGTRPKAGWTSSAAKRREALARARGESTSVAK